MTSPAVPSSFIYLCMQEFCIVVCVISSMYCFVINSGLFLTCLFADGILGFNRCVMFRAVLKRGFGERKVL